MKLSGSITSRLGRVKGWLARAALISAFLSLVLGIGQTALAQNNGVQLSDLPLFSAAQVPANLLLLLSVEYPTANSIANSAGFNPASSSTATTGVYYLGYFDPNLCYTYVYNTQDLASGATITTTAGGATPNYYAENAGDNDSGDYFQASAVAGAYGACSNAWSGAFLNWAAMQTIDPFRWALTGGYRSYDGPSTANPYNATILKKAWASGDGGAQETPNRGITANVSSFTPFTWGSFNIRLWGVGTRMQFTNTGSFDGNSGSTSDAPWTGYQTDGSKIYSVKIRVRACDNSQVPGYTLPSWCTQYPGVGSSGVVMKPEGLIQQYSSTQTVNGVFQPPSIRFGAIGYLNDTYLKRDAGVLRARMEYVGPTGTTASNSATNPNAEWSATTGVYYANPDSTDATNTNSAAAANGLPGCGSGVTCVTTSGVVNYLNGFGEVSKKYKTYDPVDELYYAGIRYFKGNAPIQGTGTTTLGGGGNAAAWSDLSTYQGGSNTNSGNMFSLIDGFPVIQQWDNPIIYACQKNFILGIGDINAHSGGNLPGTSIGVPSQNNTNNEPTLPTEVANDRSVAVGYTNAGSGAVAATNYIGGLEGKGALGLTDVGLNNNTQGNCCGDDNSFLMAGMAYDSHVNDLQPYSFNNVASANTDANGKKLQIQTVSTYWLDVQEYQNYYYQNEFWLTAKYGGFTVPTSTTYTPYVSSFPNTASWSAVGNTDASQPGPGGGGNPGHAMPNNYYGAGNAQSMVSGLQAAFASIAASSSATTTGLAASSYNSVGTAFGSYAVQYDASTWSSDVTAYSTTFNSTGLPSTTKLWDSRSIVSGYQVTTGTVTANYQGQFSVFSCSGPTPSIAGWLRPDKAPTTGCAGYGVRAIATSSGPNIPNQGEPFEIGSLTNAQVKALTVVPNTSISTISPTATVAQQQAQATLLLHYLRGDETQEYGSSTTAAGFRSRNTTGTPYLEGDIVNSSLVPVAAPSLSYTEANDPGYPEFVNSSVSTRSTAIYVGANDGMMHAYQGNLAPSAQSSTSFAPLGGSEMFSYIPSATFNGPDGVPTDAGLAALANPNFKHHFYVDATPVVTDIDYNNIRTAASPTVPAETASQSNWATVLIGGMGKGGQAYYALDVTNPDQMAASESTLASKVLWEYTDNQMGYTVGTPLLVKTAEYGWTAILMSGMNACPSTSTTCGSSATDQSNGESFIYLLNPKTGALFQKITVPAGSVGNPDGASYASALQNTIDGSIDALYFGDLLGNLWRLDLRVRCTATVTTGCDSTRASDAYATPIVMAKFYDGTGAQNPQPVTTPPTIVIDPNTGNRYVTVGTGQLLSSADLTTTAQQSFYIILDGTASAFAPASTYAPNKALTRANLVDLDGGAASTVCGVATLATGVTLSGTQSGYYFDMGIAGATGVSCRMNIPALAGVDGTVTFAGNIPSGSICNPSGSNQIFSFAVSNGAPLIVTTVNNVSTVSVNGYTAPGGAVSSLSQFNNGGGLSTDVTTQSGTNSQLNVALPTDTKLNRLNWREVPAVD